MLGRLSRPSWVCKEAVNSLEPVQSCANLSHSCFNPIAYLQGEMINESGTMSGGGGKPRGGRMCLGKEARRVIDTSTAQAELQAAEQQLTDSSQVSSLDVQFSALAQTDCSTV